MSAVGGVRYIMFNHRTNAIEASDRAPLAHVFAMVRRVSSAPKEVSIAGTSFRYAEGSGAMSCSAGGGRRCLWEYLARAALCVSADRVARFPLTFVNNGRCDFDRIASISSG